MQSTWVKKDTVRGLSWFKSAVRVETRIPRFPISGCPVSSFHLQLAFTYLTVRSSEAQILPHLCTSRESSGSRWCSLRAGNLRSDELISCRAHVGLSRGELEAWSLPCVSREMWGGGSLLFLLGKDALFYEADDSSGNLCHYLRRDEVLAV